MKKVLFAAAALAVALQASAAIEGQFIDCDAPHPTQPTQCPDNWALDLLDESKAAIQGATAAIPRDRKHYFNRTGAGVHIFILEEGIDGANPDFKVLGDPADDRLGESWGAGGFSEPSVGSHGTRVAALAAGLRFGVAKGATIHSADARSQINNSHGDGLLVRLNWIYGRVTSQTNPLKPAVLNMSFNIPRPVKDHNGLNVEPQLTQRVRDLINAGVFVTVSAGNHDSSNPGAYWPSVIPEVVLVGGIDEKGGRWVRDSTDPEFQALCVLKGDCGSNYGSLVDLWAPAKYVRSAVKKTNDDVQSPRLRSGTSFAAPLVAGLAALRLEQFPNETPAQVLAALKTNSARRNVDGTVAGDEYLVRSPVGTPPCLVMQRLFVNATKTQDFLSTQLSESCPAGYSGVSQYNAAHGQIMIGGIAPEATLYYYTPSSGYTGLDQFNYTIYTSSGSSYGTGTVKVTVQPNHN